jgi:uncharacterized protein YbjT (DUF2867 family)
MSSILVTGATGYVGASLIPRLQRAGHDVRGFARRPEAVQADVPVVAGDAISGAGLDDAMAGIDVAYFLIHSMESAASANGGFAARDREAASRFAQAARDAGVGRVVYLGGPVPGEAVVSPHLASRLEVEEILLDAAPDAVALRASIVIGARSRPFRFLVHLVERVPVIPLPAWRVHRTAPIDERDLLAYLVAAGTSDAVDGALSLDVAGPELVTYAELIERIRDNLLIGRPRLDLPFNLTPVASRVAAAITGEDHGLIGPLMGSLTSDLLPRDDEAAALFDVRRHSLDAAIERALREWEQSEPLAAR